MLNDTWNRPVNSNGPWFWKNLKRNSCTKVVNIGQVAGNLGFQSDWTSNMLKLYLFELIWILIMLVICLLPDWSHARWMWWILTPYTVAISESMTIRGFWMQVCLLWWGQCEKGLATAYEDAICSLGQVLRTLAEDFPTSGNCISSKFENILDLRVNMWGTCCRNWVLFSCSVYLVRPERQHLVIKVLLGWLCSTLNDYQISNGLGLAIAKQVLKKTPQNTCDAYAKSLGRVGEESFHTPFNLRVPEQNATGAMTPATSIMCTASAQRYRPVILPGLLSNTEKWQCH